ncbi:hypothetical protein ATOP_14730 [Granulimonas faecalis]|uniref:Uncharacterized protein n=1 Tax=Granulimonas faecalis TaxID=2894155 RepID=A0AAV5B6F2_9ACTN|nr:hypothetical protein ATOP_14730 [Granulimonas faecalis]
MPKRMARSQKTGSDLVASFIMNADDPQMTAQATSMSLAAVGDETARRKKPAGRAMVLLVHGVRGRRPSIAGTRDDTA